MVREHFAHHRLHLLFCGLAAIVMIAAIAFGLPGFAAIGALFCGAMMVMMLWMMVAMAIRANRR